MVRTDHEVVEFLNSSFKSKTSRSVFHDHRHEFISPGSKFHSQFDLFHKSSTPLPNCCYPSHSTSLTFSHAPHSFPSIFWLSTHGKLLRSQHFMFPLSKHTADRNKDLVRLYVNWHLKAKVTKVHTHKPNMVALCCIALDGLVMSHGTRNKQQFNTKVPFAMSLWSAFTGFINVTRSQSRRPDDGINNKAKSQLHNQLVGAFTIISTAQHDGAI